MKTLKTENINAAADAGGATVSAIVPAHNEAQRIGAVLETLLACSCIDEIVAVDDGSTDETRSVAAKYPVTYIRLPENLGKGQALDKGVAKAHGQVLFFCDADLRGLTPEIVREIVEPVAVGKLSMFVAMLNRRSYALRYVLSFIPLLGGQRALTRRLWERLPKGYKNRFQIEPALNFYAKFYGQGFGFKVFPGLRQTVKEKKYGLLSGFYRRCRMVMDILLAQARLQFLDVPRTLQSKRLSALGSLLSLGGLAIGLLLLVAAYTGPIQFVRSVFREELLEDPGALFINYLAYLAATVSRDVIMLVGALIVLINFFFFVLETRHLVGWRRAEFGNGRRNFSEVKKRVYN